MAFILDEDSALKTKLSNLTVTDGTATPKAVPVYFRLPENEVRAQTYPYITLDMVNIGEDTERTHRGRIKFVNYLPEGATAPTLNTVLVGEYPTPYFLDYQITTWSRMAQQDRELLAKLLTFNYLPHHFGYLNVPVPAPGTITVRRLDLMGIVNGDMVDANQKRLFRKIFNVRVSSELFISQVTNTQLALTRNLTLAGFEKLPVV